MKLKVYKKEDIRNISIEEIDKYTEIEIMKLITLPQNCPFLFSFFVNVKKIKGLDKLDTSNVTDMSYMFYECQSLTTLDLSSFDTFNVKNMSWMFAGCESLTTLDLSSFNTFNVTYMKFMFEDCKSLTSLDLNNFNTFNTIDMSFMFMGCRSLKNKKNLVKLN